MTLSSKEMLDVMAWADGELEGAEAARIEALVEKDEEAKELVRSFGALGDFVREADAKAKTPNLTEQVMARVGPNDIERARLKRGMRMRVGAAVVTLTALAAGVFLYQHSHTNVSPVVGSNDTPLSGRGGVTAPAPTGVQVGQVDTSQHAVSVFYVPSEKGPETTVVWIDENQPE